VDLVSGPDVIVELLAGAALFAAARTFPRKGTKVDAAAAVPK
jgi:hypothetical protein